MQLDADSQAFLALIKSLGRPAINALPPAQAKEMYRRGRLATQPDLPQVDRVKEYDVPGPHGPVPVRVYRGAGTADMGAIPLHVYYHGGGWVLGDLDSHDWVCRRIANEVKCAVVSVDYRMAPEHVFPAAFDDSLAALKWAVANAGPMKFDAARVTVGGDSAGGNLAAAMAIACRDGMGPKLAGQILVYPAVDLAMTGDYYGRFTKDLILTDETMIWFIDLYIPKAEQRKDWRASPLLASSLKGLPPALVVLAGFDPLYAEGEIYAQKLEAAGTKVKVTRYAGQLHGFLSNGKLLPKANDAINDIATALKGMNG
ncbi:MAG: alpha/beta hydrolase [Proteobacteria bacterium]|nr:alpha/beta hydrolase [Pseudomonadota bacterium]